MDYNVIIENIPLYLNGLWVTIQLVMIALVTGFGIAVPLALMAVSKKILLRYPAKAYIYFFRGTPLLVQMFLLYHGMGQFEAVRESVLWIVFKEAYWCAITAFALNTAAYTAEILRGAIEQTPFGEIEAANASGMSKSKLYRRIILPGSFRRALPAYGNEVIFMLHGSALAGVITINDLFGAAKRVNSRYFVPFESFITAGFFYLCCTFCIIWFFKWVEKHWYVHLRPRSS